MRIEGADGAAKNQNHPSGWFLFWHKSPKRMGQSADGTTCHIKTKFLWAHAHTGTHDQYADEQLANLQKRIWLIEFLRLGLVIVYQGALALPKIKTDLLGRFFLCFLILSQVRKLGSKNTARFANLRTFYLFSIFLLPRN